MDGQAQKQIRECFKKYDMDVSSSSVSTWYNSAKAERIGAQGVVYEITCTEVQLNNSQRLRVLQESVHECTFCYMQFNYSSGLIAHLVNMHKKLADMGIYKPTGERFYSLNELHPEIIKNLLYVEGNEKESVRQLEVGYTEVISSNFSGLGLFIR